MKLALSVFLSILISLNALATIQTPETIIYQGEAYSLSSFPLDDYFKAYPEKKPSPDQISSDLWRGYRTTFEIQDNRLIIREIQVRERIKRKNLKDTTVWTSVIDTIFRTPADRVFTWYSGYLIVQIGRIVKRVHMENSPRYENYLVIGVDKGIVFYERRLNTKQFSAFMDDQYKGFKKTEEYKQLKKKLKDLNKSRKTPLSSKQLEVSLRSRVEYKASTIFNR
jgi:hypothetical protein